MVSREGTQREKSCRIGDVPTQVHISKPSLLVSTAAHRGSLHAQSACSSSSSSSPPSPPPPLPPPPPPPARSSDCNRECRNFLPFAVAMYANITVSMPSTPSVTSPIASSTTANRFSRCDRLRSSSAGLVEALPPVPASFPSSSCASSDSSRARFAPAAAGDAAAAPSAPAGAAASDTASGAFGHRYPLATHEISSTPSRAKFAVRSATCCLSNSAVGEGHCRSAPPSK
jgi:hypothetical protein